MRCDEWNNLLDLYLDGEMPEETARALDRHTMRCPACAYELRTLEQTRRMLREADLTAVPSDGFRERTAARLRDALTERTRPVLSRDSIRQWTLPFAREDREAG